MKILNIYRDFKNFEPTFDKWKQEQDLEEKRAEVVLSQKPVTPEVLREQKRAKILVDTLTSLDEYAQTKAEDIDSVSQTVLYVAVGAIGLEFGIFALIWDKYVVSTLTKLFFSYYYYHYNYHFVGL